MGTVLALWVVLWSGLLGLHRVRVSGVSRLSAREVAAAAGVRPGTPLATLDTGAVRARVAALPPVAAVQVSRDWPSTLRITVQERQPVAVLVGAGPADRLVDKHGVVFADVPAPPKLLVPVRASGPVPGAGEPSLRAAVEVLTALPSAVRTRVTQVSAPSPVAVTLSLRGGKQVVWGGPEQSPRKAAVLAALLAATATGARQPTVYDVSTPSVAVTR